MPVMYTPLHPLSYSKTEVYRGTHFFLFLPLKHSRSWVLSEALLTCIHDLSFEQKLEKNITIFHLKMIVFSTVKNCSILHGRVIVMICQIISLMQ